MSQQHLFTPIPSDKFDSLSKSEVVFLFQESESINRQLQKENHRLRYLHSETKQTTLHINEQYLTLQNTLFGKSSEKDVSPKPKPRPPRPRKKKVQLPSERYPNTAVIERDVDFPSPPACSCCAEKMTDSGMTEDSEYLTVVPAQYLIIRQKRRKYRCSKCHGSIKTTPSPPRIKPKSGYSDEMMLDVALSKYCDLIPIERYGAIAGRNGLEGLPCQSLIELTHHVANFTKGAYEKLKEEVTLSPVLHADETPHKMLDGPDKGKSWYLWGFSNSKSSYFEIHNTRSGDVSSDLLKTSSCEYLVSDVFSGYNKTVRKVNEYRRDQKEDLPLMRNVYCNAHARRKFKDIQKGISEKDRPPDKERLWSVPELFIDIYKKIYRLEKIAQKRPPDRPDRVLRVRKIMEPHFRKMRALAMEEVAGYSSKSAMARAMNYFLNNYEGLTLFLKNADLPIDNNAQERLLRSPVVGRKTWYGTHSERGATTAAILFSLVESCKLNKVNPREFFKKLVQDIHDGNKPYTPREFKMLSLNRGE